jgi:hypothetical protein
MKKNRFRNGAKVNTGLSFSIRPRSKKKQHTKKQDRLDMWFVQGELSLSTMLDRRIRDGRIARHNSSPRYARQRIRGRIRHDDGRIARSQQENNQGTL